MQSSEPNDFNKKSIMDAMTATAPNRKQWIVKDKPLVMSILREYPQLTAYKGEMVFKIFLFFILFSFIFHY